MGLVDLFNWRSQTAVQTTGSMSALADEELAADVDEPPEKYQSKPQPEDYHTDFHKSVIRPETLRKESLLTKALKPEEPQTSHVATELSRRRSMISNGSLASASTAELTSDGGLTSPARTNTPSPPFPPAAYASFAPYSLNTKVVTLPVADGDIGESIAQLPGPISVSPTSQPPAAVAAVPKKRCITFACGGKKSPVNKVATPAPTAPTTTTTAEAPKRACSIKFACAAPKSSEKVVAPKVERPKTPQLSKTTETLRRSSSRSPSLSRKSPRLSGSSRSNRESSSSSRRTSQSPLAVRAKPKYIVADEKTFQTSEATRFHEFASGVVQDDDWIHTQPENSKEKMTIKDTLKKENAIRQLGNEAEEEALEEEEEDGNEEEDDDDDRDEEDFDGQDEEDSDGSDGNETDNEAGFADSDEESDGDGEFAFWTPGHNINQHSALKNQTPALTRASSISSNDDDAHRFNHQKARRPRRPSPIKIRPGTPDLPDSTDFVCGTLDEDRPMEEAYVSCMEARRNAKHKQTPQDIDPSFPTSDIDVENDEDEENKVNNDSDEPVWLHGKFEDSDEEFVGRRKAVASRRRSPGQSPRRLRSPPPPKRFHSPPPAKTRLRSPPPPMRLAHSPDSPATSPAAANGGIPFAPLGSRPGLTHTKSLPRTPNAFCRQYRAARLEAANGLEGENTDGHVRGAIDIVKGLEHKRQRRREKFLRKVKNQTERKPQPGKGAERMRELGLLMAGKPNTQDPYMMSA